MKNTSHEKSGTAAVDPRKHKPQQVVGSRAKKSSAVAALNLKEILVPVDFTDCTGKALAYAIPFAQQFDAGVTLLHVVEPTYVPATEIAVMVDLGDQQDANRELDQLRTRLPAGVRCRTMVCHGIAETEIIRVARELNCDLIILSTHGRTGMERLLLGSTVEKVMRRAGCPIIVVRPHEHDFVSDVPADGEAEDKVDTKIEAEMKAGI